MPKDPILLVGGSGIAGGWAARWLREAHPDQPLLIGGRDLDRARKAADALGNAEAVALDLACDDLGLEGRPVGAVAVFFTDQRVAALGFAQARGVPYVNIAPGLHELGPEMAAYMHRPDAAPVVLGTEWLVGATSVPTMVFARAFGRIDEIAIGALLDEQDAFGPAALGDYERQTGVMDAALVRRDGAFAWRGGADATSTIRAVDGTEVPATAAAFNDVLGLSTALGVPNVRFDLAFGESSSRRRGDGVSTEILIELAGEDRAGQPLRTRHAIVHPRGQMPLTGLGVALLLERLTGLDDGPATPPGLYFPCQLLDPDAYVARLRQAGGVVQALQPGPANQPDGAASGA